MCLIYIILACKGRIIALVVCYIKPDNVENFILLKSNEEYFTDPVCKNGYFRGIETYNFVRDIVSRYESYKKKIKA